MCRCLQRPKGVLDLLQLELQVLICVLMDAENCTQVLWKNSCLSGPGSDFIVLLFPISFFIIFWFHMTDV